MAILKSKPKPKKTKVGGRELPATWIKRLIGASSAEQLIGDSEAMDAKAHKMAASFLLHTAKLRGPHDTNIAVESFTGDDGRLATRIAIVNRDMPFLVDSAAGLLSEMGADVRQITHPRLPVLRGKDGALKDVMSAAGEENGEDVVRESFIYIEAARMDARTRRETEKALKAVMRDVQAAVQDWPKMKAKLEANAERVVDSEWAGLLRWFGENKFTLLAHEKATPDGKFSERLGLCRASKTPIVSKTTIDQAVTLFGKAHDGPLILKASRSSTVHRNVLLDVIITPIFEAGVLTGLSIIAGLWTSAALSAPVSDVPVLKRGHDKMFEKFGFDRESHAGKAMQHELTNLPHDLLVTFDQTNLERITLTAMSLSDRPRPKLLTMRSALGRHIFAFVWIPRDSISTRMREAVQNMVAKAANARVLGWTFSLEDGGLALLRFTLDLKDRSVEVDETALQEQLDTMLGGWEPGVESELTRLSDAKRAHAMIERYADAFSADYRAYYPHAEAAQDMIALVRMERDHRPITRIYIRNGDDAAQLRLKVYNEGAAVPLSNIVPVLENFGFEVMEERPSKLNDGKLGYIHDFKLKTSNGMSACAMVQDAATIEKSLSDVLIGAAEDDDFNGLISLASINPQAVIWLRAWFRYMRQTGSAYGMRTVVEALASYPQIAGDLVDLFTALHDPDFEGDRAKAASKLDLRIANALKSVDAIDDDRILVQYHSIVQAVQRTNAFAMQDGEALAFKIRSEGVAGLPKPLPWREVWVYSPRVEGIHLRAGPVARGGIRWSNRRDDFRTEVLGLMKAQRVKNAVIVPTGAKGGFYPKQLPNMQDDRDAWMEEGTEAYRIYIRSLLSITDNIVEGKVVHPKGVVRRDDDDPYFVVAADKGTASFSDVANAIALEREFWLGDAFASGGSVGYDHKAMGITAKGAWVSVQRHFKEIGVDVQNDPVTVAGVGDMSGDVFGNGMLLSKSIKLVAAFDHRHIFIDPDPNPESGFKERERLFNLDRSSWEDYDKRRISNGGGVFARSAKTVKVSAQIRELLDIDEEELSPTKLIRAILRARVDLMWFGGIGTYIKSAAENNIEVGDHANDAVRVDAGEVRAKAIGEGANLGVTQDGRIAFAKQGGRINTDFIDNSAGVDCSDNEVNIKIALNAKMREGKLKEAKRNELLESMTDAVADIVLEDNRLQTLALSISESGGVRDLEAYVRLIEILEGQGRLDRDVEGLAGNEELLRRANEGQGLTRPELAILLSTTKLAAQDAAEETGLARDTAFENVLLGAFPEQMAKKHKQAIFDHRLRNEIVSTKVANQMINRLGMLAPFELAEEEGCGLQRILRAFAITSRLLGMEAIWHKIDEADIEEGLRLNLFGSFADQMRDHMADLIRNGDVSGKAGEVISDYAPLIKKLKGRVPVPASVQQRSDAIVRKLTEAGVPDELAGHLQQLRHMDGAIGLAALVSQKGGDIRALAQAYAHIGESLSIGWAQSEAMTLEPQDPWERLLVAGIGRDFQTMRLRFLRQYASDKPVEQTREWLENNDEMIEKFCSVMNRARAAGNVTPAMLAQIAGQARSLLN